MSTSRSASWEAPNGKRHSGLIQMLLHHRAGDVECQFFFFFFLYVRQNSGSGRRQRAVNSGPRRSDQDTRRNIGQAGFDLAHFVNEFVFSIPAAEPGVFGTDIIDVLRKGGRGVLERAKGGWCRNRRHHVRVRTARIDGRQGGGSDPRPGKGLVGGSNCHGHPRTPRIGASWPWVAMRKRSCAAPRFRCSWFGAHRSRPGWR